MNTVKPALVEQWHQELSQQIEHLKTLSSWPGDDVSGVPLVDRIRQSLGEFRVTLPGHFSLEEQGGYMAEPLARAPHLRTLADRLHAQHAALIDRFLELYHRSQRAADATELRRDVLLALNELREHESSENELWQSSWMDEPAAND